MKSRFSSMQVTIKLWVLIFARARAGALLCSFYPLFPLIPFWNIKLEFQILIFPLQSFEVCTCSRQHDLWNVCPVNIALGILRRHTVAWRTVNFTILCLLCDFLCMGCFLFNSVTFTSCVALNCTHAEHLFFIMFVIVPILFLFNFCLFQDLRLQKNDLGRTLFSEFHLEGFRISDAMNIWIFLWHFVQN